MNKDDATMLDGHEQVLLGAMMNGCGDLPLAEDDFASPPNRTIYLCLSGLKSRGLLAVQAELQRRGELAAVGGPARLTYIQCLPHDSVSVEFALGEVLEASRQRRAMRIFKDGVAGKITPDEAQAQLAQLHERSGALPSIEDAAELVRQPLELPEDVIEGILHRAAKMVLGGGSKTFKTWTLVDLAVSVATGTAWMGHFATKRGCVLYINLELQGAFFAKRLFDVCSENQVTLESGYLTVWNLRGRACDLSKLRPLLLRAIEHDKYVLIIIDPIYKLLGLRDENKAGDIASLLNEIEALAVETGAAVAFGAHYSKGNQAGKEVIDRIGGSGVFARDPDSILNFTRHEEENCFTVDATLRNHPPIKSFVARWEYPLMCVDSLLDPDKLKQAKGAAIKQYHSTELAAVLVRPMSAVELKKVAQEETGMSDSTFYRLFRELKESGALILNAEGKWNKK